VRGRRSGLGCTDAGCPHGKIVPRRISGVCAPRQRRLTDATKKARNIALLPFAAQF
jgi:ribosomal protein S18